MENEQELRARHQALSDRLDTEEMSDEEMDTLIAEMSEIFFTLYPEKRPKPLPDGMRLLIADSGSTGYRAL